MQRDDAAFSGALFIVGCGRSGTTLLRTILNRHAEIDLSHECRFVPFMARHRSRYEGASFQVDRFVHDLYTLPTSRSRFGTWGLEQDTVRSALADAKPQGLAEAIRTVYGLRAHNGSRVWGDKAPGLTPHMRCLAQVFPGARFIHIVRDGRDVASAYLSAPFGPRTVAQAAALWRSQVCSARRAGNELGPERFTEVRYEDLIASPEPEVARLCAFLDVSMDPGMLGGPGAPEPDGDLVGQTHHRSTAQPIQQGLRDWRTELGPDAIGGFEVIAGPVLESFGYARSEHVDVRPAVRVRSHGRRLYERSISKPVKTTRRHVGDHLSLYTTGGPDVLRRLVGR